MSASPAPRLFFEDLPVGAPVRFGTTVVSSAEIESFERDYGGGPATADTALAASPWHVCALMMRMLCDDLLTNSACIASPGIEQHRWPRPVLVGDQLWARREILEARRSLARPEVGRLRMSIELFNQRDELVMSSVVALLFHCRNRPEAP